MAPFWAVRPEGRAFGRRTQPPSAAPRGRRASRSKFRGGGRAQTRARQAGGPEKRALKAGKEGPEGPKVEGARTKIPVRRTRGEGQKVRG